MKRVTGIGGIFFKAKDPAALAAWYQRHLGLAVQPWGGAVFTWADDAGQPVGGTTIWSVAAQDAERFSPGVAPFMVNYRVADMRALVAVLREEGCQVLEPTEDGAHGRFAWVMDPEGNKVELWEPPPGQ